MNLQEYFTSVKGTGLLATASRGGETDIAVYSRPRIMTDGTLAFLMRDRLTHHNLTENVHAAYAFLEEGGGYRGIRLFLRKIREDADPEVAAQMTRRHLSAEEDAAKGPKFVVYFSLEKVLTLVGGKELDPKNLEAY